MHLMRTTTILHLLLAPIIVGLAAVIGVDAAPDLRLVDAAQARNWAVVQRLLQEKVDTNATQPDGSTALHWAVHHDHVEMAKTLLEAGARVDAANELAVTPLALAAQNGSVVMGRLLLSKGANPNAPFLTGETPLMTASETGNLDLVTAMLSAGGDPNAKERTQDQTSLMWAAAEKHPAVVQALIRAGADVHARSKGGSTPLLFAARSGDLESARQLIEAGSDVNAAMLDGSTALIVAAGSGHGELGVWLLDHGANPNAATGEHGITALHSLIFKRPLHAEHWKRPAEHLLLAKALLDKGANPNATLTKAPTGMGINVTGTIWPGATPFVLGARVADVDMLKLLIGKGDPTIVTTNRTTTLMAAAGVGRNEGNEDPISETSALEAVKLFAELGVDINAADTSGLTALHGATNNGYNAIIQYLHDRGVNLNAKDKDGWTALNNAEIYRNNFQGAQGVGCAPPQAWGNRVGTPSEEGVLKILTFRSSVFVALGGIIAAFSETPARAQQPENQRTVWSGIYSSEQASRGNAAFNTHCRSCHGTDLRGGEGSALIEAAFMLHWSGRTVAELFEYVRKGMPEDAASTVSDADKLDILAFIFERNGFPAGERPLTAEGLGGARILIEEKNGPTPPPTGATVRTVGCVMREGGGWILRDATDPVRTTVDPAAVQPDANLTQSRAGTATFQLIGASGVEAHQNQRVAVIGLMIRSPKGDSLNVLRMTPEGTGCPASGG